MSRRKVRKAGTPQRQPRAREVVATDGGAIMRQTLPPRGHIEVRERKDYSWRVWYPDEGFVPCAPVCELRHSHDYHQKHVESYYRPTDRADAESYARQLAEGRDVKVVPYQGIRAPRAA